MCSSVLDTQVPNLVDEGDDEDFQYVEKSSEEGVSLVTWAHLERRVGCLSSIHS